MEFFLPIANLNFNPFLILIIGIGGGIVSNILGIGGGVFVTPLLIMFGIPPVVAFPSQLYNAIGNNLMGFLVHFRRFNVDFALAWYLFIGGFFGALCEIFLYQYFLKTDSIVLHLNLIYVIILFLVGLVLLFMNIKFLYIPKTKKANVTMKSWMIYLPWHRVFLRARVEMSIIVPLGIGFTTGLMTTILGGGVSMLIMPTVAYLIGRSTLVVSGTARLTAFALTIIISVIQGWQHAVGDYTIVILLLIGSAFGAHLGREMTKFISLPVLGIIGAVSILILAGQFLFNFYQPVNFIVVPTPKINLPTTLDLYHNWQFAKGWSASILEFAYFHPVAYTLCCIFMVLIIAYFLEKLVRQSIETFYYAKEHILGR